MTYKDKGSYESSPPCTTHTTIQTGVAKNAIQKEGGQILCVQNMYLKRGGADLVHALHVLTHIITLVGGSKRI